MFMLSVVCSTSFENVQVVIQLKNWITFIANESGPSVIVSLSF